MQKHLTITITITKFNQRRRCILKSRSQLLYCFKIHSAQYFSCSDMNSSNVVGHLNCFFLNVNLDQTKEAFITVIQTCTLNVMFSLLTCARNIIILHVIWKKQELHSPSFTLLFCLSASDLLVGLICQPCLVVVYNIAEISENFNLYCTFRTAQTISSYITSGMSLATLSGVSIDRLLAITLHLRYNMVVTVADSANCFSPLDRLYIPLRFWISKCIIFPTVLCLSTFVVTTLSTLKIFQIVRRHQRLMNQQQQGIQINTVTALTCRKSAVTVLFMVCSCNFSIFLSSGDDTCGFLHWILITSENRL